MTTTALFPDAPLTPDPDAWVKALSPVDREVLARTPLPDLDGRMRPASCTWPELDDARREVAYRRGRDVGRGVDRPITLYIEVVVQERVRAAARERWP